uniref:C-type lectin domain-containing protein n=1 Tax=Caenorhabditis tropicalis TaxID=1561998 RepID=A0A1I7V4F0_9PELO
MTTQGDLLTECLAGCPSGWQYVYSKRYKVFSHYQWSTIAFFQKFNQAVTYDQAVSACQGQGAELVTIESSHENDALRKAFDTNALVDESMETWIGLKSSSGSWLWTDGSVAEFTNWAQTQPSSNAQCVQMITDSLINSTYQYQRGGWKTYDCSKTSASYICEKNAAV